MWTSFLFNDMWNNRIEFLLVSFFCICSLALPVANEKRSDRYVVVLSMDGFRSDYPSRAHTPTLDSLANFVGVRAPRFAHVIPA